MLCSSVERKFTQSNLQIIIKTHFVKLYLWKYSLGDSITSTKRNLSTVPQVLAMGSLGIPFLIFQLGFLNRVP